MCRYARVSLCGARWCAIVAAACLLVGCPSRRGPDKPDKKNQISLSSRGAGTPFQVARYMPARPTYAFVAANLTQLVEAVRGLLRPVQAVERSFTADRFDRSMRREFGFNPFDLGALGDAGFDLEASAAVFSASAGPTVLLPIKDRRRLERFLAARVRNRPVYVKRRGEIIATTMQIDSASRLSWAVVGDYLALRVLIKPRDVAVAEWKRTTKWLDRVGAKRARTFADSRAMRWALAGAGKRRDALFYARPRALRRAIASHLPKPPPRCAAARADLDNVKRVALVAKLKKSRVDIVGRVELGGALASALKAMSAAAPSLPAALWSKSPLRMHVALDVQQIAKMAERYRERRCGVAFEVLREFRYLPRLFRRMPLLAAARGRVAVALAAAQRSAQGTLGLDGAIALGVDATAASQLKRRLPLATGKTETIAGKSVEQLAPVGVTTTEPLRLHVGATQLSLTAGNRAIKQLLAGGSKGPPPGTLLSIHAKPSDIADLRAPMKLFERTTGRRRVSRYRRYRYRRYRRYGRYGRFAGIDALLQMLGTFRQFDLSARVVGKELRLVARTVVR